jgi:hypothetical protein
MSGLLCFCADVHKGKSAASAVIRIDHSGDHHGGRRTASGSDARFQVDDLIAEANCMDEVLVSKVIEKISQTGTAFLDIIHLADLHLEDGKPLDLPKIRKEAETGFKNMEELNAAFAKLVNPDVG